MTVGCETHTYTITDRDSGGTVASSGTLTSVEYNRILNDSSDARIVLGTAGADCCDDLGEIRSWRHILNLYRGSDFMWSGFITNVDWKLDEVLVDAVDIIGLLDRRVPHQEFDFRATDPTVIGATLVDDALAPDDPGHRVTIVAEAGVDHTRVYERWVGQTGDHLRDLSDTGIDFTAVGNNVVLMGDRFCDVVGYLSDADLPDGLTVSEDGTQLATRRIVAGTDQGSAVGAAGGVNPYYGLLEIYTEQNSITDQVSADTAAQGALEGSLAAPVYIDTQNITLAPHANVDVDQLVPGWCLVITSGLTCRRITQRLKITGLKVSEDGAQERVTVQVAATGEDLELGALQ